jgi:hypothetical protein
MGILSALRKVTGKSAEVDLTVTNTKRGEKAKFAIDVHVGSDALKAKRVYVKLRCSEVIDLPNYHAPLQTGGQGGSNYIHVRASETLFDQEFAVAEAQDLPAGTTAQFTAEIDIPANSMASFIGRNARIQWEALAGLDVAWATDPSSGWQDIMVT